MVALLPLVGAIGAGGAVLLIWMALTGGDDAIARRLDRAALKQPAPAKGRPNGLRRASHYSSVGALDALLRRMMPNPAKLRRRLARTGLAMTLGEYVLACAVVGLIAGALFASQFGFGLKAAAAIGVGLGLGLPHLAVGYLGGRRIGQFLNGFPDAIDLIVRGVRSGLPATESIVNVGRELPDPIGIEFRRVADAVRLGVPLEDALWEVSDRLDTPEFRFFIIALAIQRETGGNLAETLSNLSTLLRRRRQVKLKIKALSSEARASAWIIGSLPFGMFAIISTLSSGYATLLTSDPRGLMMTGVGLLFIGIGAAVMAKMVKFEI